MDFEKAQHLLARYNVVERKPAIAQQTVSGLALVAELREDWKEAEGRLRELLKLTPEALVARQRLARALFWQGRRGRRLQGLDGGQEHRPRECNQAQHQGDLPLPGSRHGPVLQPV